MNQFSERESWLSAAALALQGQVFTRADIDPALWESRRYRLSCGFPIGFRGSRKGKVVIGQAFDPSISADGTSEVFINPILDKSSDVLAVLAHELIHVWAGVQCGHRGEFARIARAIDLVGPLTATRAGNWLEQELGDISQVLGAYPHAAIDPNSRKKQTTRLLKLHCNSCDWTARVSALQADRLHEGSVCPVCMAVDSLIVDR